jgi:hypothetical protein
MKRLRAFTLEAVNDSIFSWNALKIGRISSSYVRCRNILTKTTQGSEKNGSAGLVIICRWGDVFDSLCRYSAEKLCARYSARYCNQGRKHECFPHSSTKCKVYQLIQYSDTVYLNVKTHWSFKKPTKKHTNCVRAVFFYVSLFGKLQGQPASSNNSSSMTPGAWLTCSLAYIIII